MEADIKKAQDDIINLKNLLKTTNVSLSNNASNTAISQSNVTQKTVEKVNTQVNVTQKAVAKVNTTKNVTANSSVNATAAQKKPV